LAFRARALVRSFFVVALQPWQHQWRVRKLSGTALSNVDVLRARSHSIALDVTGKCNLRCSYCHKADPVYEALPASNADMAGEVIDRIYRYCKESGVKEVTLSGGGETTFLPNWHGRIAQFLDDPEIEPQIVSNFARLFSDEDLAALVKFKAIQISFDSSDLEVVRKLRSKADLRTITFNIIKLRQKGTELGRTPTLVVNCTLWRNNIGGIEALARFCRELGIDQLLLTEGFISTKHNNTVPDTLDTVTDADVVKLAHQIIAAENALFESLTSLRLQDHLQQRLSEVLAQMRHGQTPKDAAASFHRRRGLSACRQPWQSPIVLADGKVLACCVAGGVAPLGELTGTTTMAEILESNVARTVRASILEGKPVLPCENCSFASDLPFEDFIADIHEWQGVPSGAAREVEARSVPWPGILGVPEHQVTLENARLNVSAGIALLSENDYYGHHRVLIDWHDCSEITLRCRPKGRGRIRLDLAAERGRLMIARLHVAATRAPSAEVAMGELGYRLESLSEGWLQLIVQSAKSFSHFNLTLMRDENTVSYRGDDRSAIEISDLRVS
jgi:MoaA/NifB/PqqE/SkfB family radical SAM enzyme